MKILGLTTTIYLSSWQRSPKTLICEGIQQQKTPDLSIKETVISTDEKENAGFFERLKWLKWLWVPMLVLLSVSMGSQYPVPVVVAVGFLLWSTKPYPASIYNWVEKVGQFSPYLMVTKLLDLKDVGEQLQLVVHANFSAIYCSLHGF
jgi:hypothetical protein